ncbi:response regulator transcription factor [Glaciecola sp. 1036]|uniref:helix-turn-helix transcriptional regulator n=1 Tax=Alteromonadaceae TaxID=72275 RepID=UPI003D0359D5
MAIHAFILTRHTLDLNRRSKTSIGHFIDLLDACGYSAKIGTIQPSNQTIAKTDFCFIDAEFCNHNVLLNLPLVRQYPKLKKVIFNVDEKDQDFQYAALKLGLSGVLIKDESLDLTVKGLQQLKQDNKWFSRKLLTRFINDTLQNSPNLASTKMVAEPLLTKRELAITERIADGAQNQEIADNLHISVNTVKTHIYSIFRKTECRNRVELIKWYNERIS